MRSRWRKRVVSIPGVGENLTQRHADCDVIGNIPESLDASCLEVSNMIPKTPHRLFNLPLPSHAARLPIYPHTTVAQVRLNSLGVHVLTDS